MTNFKHNFAALSVAVLLSACQPATQTTTGNTVTTLDSSVISLPGAVHSSWALPDQQRFLTVSEDSGIELRSGDTLLAHLPGAYKHLSVRPLAPQRWLFVTIDARRDQALVGELDAATATVKITTPLSGSALLVDNLCLFADPTDGSLSTFIQDSRGRAEQWLLAQRPFGQFAPKLLRTMAQPHDINSCVVDDSSASLYINEPELGIWRYPARVEANPERIPLALRTPHGKLPEAIESLALGQGGDLYALAESGNRLYHWATPAGDIAHPAPFSSWQLRQGHGQTITVSPTANPATERLTLANEDVAQLVSLTRPAQSPVATKPIAVVFPSAETAVADRFGDAMDDPAIWVNPNDPARSRVLGTHKKQGLKVYDLQGALLQSFDDGKLNNVDLRDGFKLAGETLSLVAASNRNDNSLTFYGIDSQGQVKRLGSAPTVLDPIYGLCMGRSATAHYVFANDKTGRVAQYRIEARADGLHATLQHQFKLASQPEGCTFDDQRQRLFVGEEDRGIWALDLAQAPVPAPQLIAEVGEVLVDDIEGMALSQDAEPLLVVSSQGNNSYQVFQGTPPYAHLGGFRVGMNGQAGIDGASETDGLELSTRLRSAEYPGGLLVVQDGRNRMPDQPQNFKYISWHAVLETLKLAQPAH